MKRLRELCVVCAALVEVGVIVMGCGDRAVRTIQIGVLSQAAPLEPLVEGFTKGMTDLGYAEGERVRYVYEGPALVSRNTMLSNAQRMVDGGVDLILSVGTTPTQCAQQATAETGTPIVFALVDDPVGAGIIETQRQPGGRTTGVTYFGLQEPPRMRWLMEMAPHVRRVYVPCAASGDETTISMALTREASDKLGVELLIREIGDSNELRAAVEAIPPEADAIFLPPDSLVTSIRDEWIAAAIARKLPLSAPNEYLVREGALVSYGLSLAAAGEQAARLADRILRGTNAGDLPVEIPEFFLSINLKTAEAIGLHVPDEVLCQADEIFR